MNILAACLAAASSALALSLCAEQPQFETIFKVDLSGDGIPAGWKVSKAVNASLAKGEGVDGGNCFKFQIEPGKETQDLMSFKLDASAFKGRAVLLEAMVKGKDISKADPPWLGAKLMLHVKAEDGVELWPDMKKTQGSFDWKKESVFARLPDDLASIELCLGLQANSGTLWIDKIQIKALPLPEEPTAAVSRGELQKSPSLRGVMSGSHLEDSDMKTLGEAWNANLLRFQIGNSKKQDVSTPEKTDRWLAAELERLDKTIVHCRKHGIKILIDLHCGPGMNQNELMNNLISWDKGPQDEIVRVWRHMAARYKDEPVVWAYDILNEPREDNYKGENLDWNRLAERIAKAIREIDPVKPIVIEPSPWASPDAFKGLKPFNIPNIIYSVHFYKPTDYTHQGVGSHPQGFEYPGKISGVYWDKEMIAKTLEPVAAFQRKYKVPIYVGEFGVARWTPGDHGLAWLRDSIDYFEAHGWDWSYHAFREWDGWDAEMGSDKNDKTRLESTPRLELLKSYFKRNAK